MNASIVIVEDEGVVALDLSSSLRQLGYRVKGLAARADQALDLVAEHQPDLVLMDIHLEGEVDGIEAAREIQARFRTPVVYLTAYAEEATLQRAETTRPYGYLLKPFEARTLEATLRMALARRQAELATEQSEQRLRLAMDTAGLGVMEWEEGSSQTSLTHVAGHVEAILGATEELIRQGWPGVLGRMSSNDRQQVKLDLQDEGELNRTVRMRLRDNRWGWADLQARAYPAEDDARRLVGVIRDVTSREDQQDELRQASAVFNTAQEAIVVMGADQAIITVNPAFKALMGYELGEVRGRHVEDFLHQHARSTQFYKGLSRTPHGRWHGEVACRHQDGRTLLTWQEVSVVRGKDGEPSHFVMAYSDLTPIKAAQNQLDYLTFHDEITGLGNHHLLQQELRKAMQRAASQSAPPTLVLLLINIDRFRQVNESFGNQSGNLLIKAVAHHLRKHLASSDMIMRVAHDDFAVMLPAVPNSEEAIRLAHTLISQLQVPMTLPGHHSVRLSASVGLAYYPEHTDRPERLMQQAQSALYDAKVLGRGRCSVYSPELAHRERERHELAEQLRAELRNPRQLALHYQPVVALDGRKVVALEALLRWNHHEFGQTHPRALVRMADDLGLLDVLDGWILRNACRLGRTLHDMGHEQMVICVNVSGTQLHSANFAEMAAQVLRETGFPAACLELEFHESVMLIARDQREVLMALRALGVRLVIDDLGTGMSSISMLKQLQFHRVKIDGSLVREAPVDADASQIVKAMVELAQGLDIAVTAEGIETPQQLLMLQAWGCGQGQGYLFGAALPAEKIPGLLRHGLGQGDAPAALH
jgi:diguanylate cyclase (GGDEF)-like protein/PAS domain S-box-containing protein